MALNSKRLIKSGYGGVQGDFKVAPRTRRQDKLSHYIIIKKGEYKSHKAFIKRAIGNKYVVELASRAKVITLTEDAFKRLELAELEHSMPSVDTHAFKTPA